MQGLFWTIKAFYTRTQRRRIRARIASEAQNASFPATPSALVSYPEPRSIGNFQRGQQMLIGNFRFNGTLVEAPDKSIWDIGAEPRIMTEIQGFDWMDDLAATGRPGAQAMQRWTADWIKRFGEGTGPGWQPQLTGRRLIRWISHAIPLLQGQEKEASNAFLKSLGRQGVFLSKTWGHAPAGLPRLEALTGLVYVALAIEDLGDQLEPATRQLGDICEEMIRRDGGIASRSPEELLQVFTLLTWASRSLTEAGHDPDRRHTNALERIAPTLRTITLGGGALARFHGGDIGEEGHLDFALADAGIRAPASDEPRMGYLRLASGRTTCVIDAAPPPEGSDSEAAHASTLAFELSSGGRALIVNSGPGRWFGERWRRAARATGCHSTLVIENASSAQIWNEGYVGDTFGERLAGAPRRVTVKRGKEEGGKTVLLTHNGYVPAYGLTHSRLLGLATNGTEILGEDKLFIRRPDHRRAYRRAQSQPVDEGLSFALHFHIHPDVATSLDLGGNAVSLKLRNDEIWVFRQTGGLIALQDGVYLDQQHVRPRITKQIVVQGLTENAEAAISWRITRTQEGRRLTQDETDAFIDVT